MQQITKEQFAQMLIDIDARKLTREWAKGKDWQVIYATASAKDLVWLFVCTQGAQPNFKKIFANILCDILRPIQDKLKAASLTVLPALEAWGRGEAIDMQAVARIAADAADRIAARTDARNAADAAETAARAAARAADAAEAAKAYVAPYAGYYADAAYAAAYGAAYGAGDGAGDANAYLGAILRTHAPIESWNFSKFVK